MGNKNTGRLTRLPSTSSSPFNTDKQSKFPQSIDLDEMIERSFWSLWERTKSKSFRHYKQDDLQMKLNWSRVIFHQSNVQFFNVHTQHLLDSRVLFRTNFVNKTSNHQSYSVKTNRKTRSTFQFTFAQYFTITEQCKFRFELPEELVEFSSGVQREQSLDLEKIAVNEQEMQWSVNSNVEVDPQTCVNATLTIDEVHYKSDFRIPIEFMGRISATVCTKQTPNIPLAFFEGDIVEIFRQLIESQYRMPAIVIIEEKKPIVRFMLSGHCEFRYGIKQNLKLDQMPLNPVPSSISQDSPSSTRYRSVQTSFVSPTIHQQSNLSKYKRE